MMTNEVVEKDNRTICELSYTPYMRIPTETRNKLSSLLERNKALRRDSLVCFHSFHHCHSIIIPFHHLSQTRFIEGTFDSESSLSSFRHQNTIFADLAWFLLPQTTQKRIQEPPPIGSLVVHKKLTL